MATRLFFLLEPSTPLADKGFVATSHGHPTGQPPPILASRRNVTSGSVTTWTVITVFLAIGVAQLGFMASGTKGIDVIRLVVEKVQTLLDQ
jgi:hypothetical protein